jgi:RNA polymerase sigma factor (sigma-70 family)
MELLQDPRPDAEVFSAFIGRIEPGLKQALVATYGPVDGREATVEALSWAWENWERLNDIDNPLGYLYRVGQTATRRFAATAIPHSPFRELDARMPDIEPGLLPALETLSAQQRSVVLLVHAHGWSQADVARMLDVNPSTVREHLARGMKRLRNELEAHDAD